eukprot:SAG31_NODE_1430_length_8385_cov_3.096186_10_plen_22_part_01
MHESIPRSRAHTARIVLTHTKF